MTVSGGTPRRPGTPVAGAEEAQIGRRQPGREINFPVRQRVTAQADVGESLSAGRSESSRAGSVAHVGVCRAGGRPAPRHLWPSDHPVLAVRPLWGGRTRGSPRLCQGPGRETLQVQQARALPANREQPGPGGHGVPEESRGARRGCCCCQLESLPSGGASPTLFLPHHCGG